MKLIHYDEPTKMARESQIVRAKEILNVSHDRSSQRQSPDTNQQMIKLIVSSKYVN